MKRYNITVNGSVYDVMVEESDSAADSPAGSVPVAAPKAQPAPAAPAGKQGEIKIEAPMPGTIIAVKAKEGDEIQKGTVIAVLEAMKMENDIVSAGNGVLVSINVKKGESVNTGTVIATMSNS